ncbi:ATP-binding protein [Luteolibacter luteus]|uniref:ATP-binding protein n=1 Tax=Luteolibacter luteus TaxID=2728835 RepID=A0A858RLN7_9BACT|nr:ATP-binding protein [Luteolibacter luteus]QJE97867.1 ATP-binding protein [Luteolibacter luteus]
MSQVLHPLPPDAARVIEGLRDTGYQFNTAVADVVDNSIAADAKNISIFLKQDYRGNISLRIYDDGVGMTKDGVLNAMTYGSQVRTSKASLGKFGLGLKTGSTAFCRRLVVVSRANPEDTLITAAWDIDHVKISGKWEITIGESSPSESKFFNEVLADKAGTLVIWEKIDRIMKAYKDPTGPYAKKAFEKIIDGPNGLRQHLATVYQRFLDPADNRATNIKIALNGTPVEAWDPFCVGESELVGDENISVSMPGGSVAEFRIRAFILPRKEEFSSEEAKERARVAPANQGIYVYRENRFTHGPDWLGLFARETHMTLLRIEFSFDHRLDEAFQIDIKKSQIILDEAISVFVKEFLTPRRRAADLLSRKGARESVKKTSQNAHDGSNRNISSKEDQVIKPNIKSLDAASGEAVLVNRLGEVRLKLQIGASTRRDEVHIQTVESIDDGLLWTPAFIDGHCAVNINRGHPYYTKVYVPNLSEGVTIQGMDALLWGLSVAELNCISEDTKTTFEDLRYEVSRNLKKLVQDLPEPEF